MSGGTIDNPILNGPYDPPEQYFELSPQGPTGVVKEGRRPSESLVPIPQSKKGTQAADGSLQPTLDVELTGERREHNALINDIRRALEMWGRADHDHLTRGLAYAVARHARGLVVVAEEHRDEFRALAQYLNEMAEHDADRGVSVWLVEAKAVQIAGSPWAPLFTAVVEPNAFTANVEQAKQSEAPLQSLDEFWESFDSDSTLSAAREVVGAWATAGYRRRLGPNHIVLQAKGPSKNGLRTVVAIYSDGRILVPFSSYAGENSGISIDPLTTNEFRSAADALFGFTGSERQPRTTPGWLAPANAHHLLQFCTRVAEAYKAALESEPTG